MKRTRPSSSSSSGSASPPPRPIRNMPKRTAQPVVQYLSTSSKMIPISPQYHPHSSDRPTPRLPSESGVSAKSHSKPRIPSDGSRTRAKWLTHRRPSDGFSETTETSIEDAIDVGLADTSEVDDNLDNDNDEGVDTAAQAKRETSPVTDEGDAVDDLIGYTPPPSSPPSEKYVKNWLEDVKGKNRQEKTVEHSRQPLWPNFNEKGRHASHKKDRSLEGRSSRSSTSMVRLLFY